MALRLLSAIDSTFATLMPGLFVRVQVPFPRPYDALLGPQTALAMNQQGRYVLVVDQENQVAVHVVEVGTAHGDRVVIKSGLSADDRVVIAAEGPAGQQCQTYGYWIGSDGQSPAARSPSAQMISRFFIDRPLAANVIAIVVTRSLMSYFSV